MTPPERVGTLVGRVVPQGDVEDAPLLRVYAIWEKVVSERVYDNARPVHLKHGALIVNTATSAWASALQLESERILEGLRKHLPSVAVRKLVFRPGALPPTPPRAPKRRPPPVLRPVTELPEEIARALAHIADDDVRDAVARAASAGLAKRGREPGAR
jgi:hypothetical protein